MATKPRVVVTGASGLIGSVLTERLPARYDIVGVDRVRSRTECTRKADLTRLSSARRALAGAEVVVDLVAEPPETTSWSVIDRYNVTANLNVLEAARNVGARRVILASSNQVTGGYEREQPYADIVAGAYANHTPGAFRRLTTRDLPRPANAYAVGKLAAEEMARLYSEEFGLSVICLRIGTVTRLDQPISPRHFATLLSHRDAAQLVERGIEAPPELRYARLYGVSDNLWRIWDIDDARDTIGYVPLDDAEQWRDQVRPPARDQDRSTDHAADVILDLLRALDHLEGKLSGNRLHHSLRTATLAEQAGADDQLVVAALCHDIGSTMRGSRHGPISARVIEPYVRREVSWTVAVHEHFIARHKRRGLRRYARYRHLFHPHYRLARRFVDEWDVPAQRDGCDFKPLEHFEPRLRRVVATPLPHRSRNVRLFELVTKPLPRPVAERLERSIRAARRRRAAAA